MYYCYLKFAHHKFGWADSRVPKECKTLYKYRRFAAIRQIEDSAAGKKQQLARLVSQQQHEPPDC